MNTGNTAKLSVCLVLLIIAMFLSKIKTFFSQKSERALLPIVHAHKGFSSLSISLQKICIKITKKMPCFQTSTNAKKTSSYTFNNKILMF